MPGNLVSAIARRQVDSRLLALVVLGFLALLVAGVAAGFARQQTQSNAHWVIHSYQVDREIGAIKVDVERMRAADAMGVRASADYAAAKADLISAVDRAAALTRDNPGQQAAITALRQQVALFDRALGADIGPAAGPYSRIWDVTNRMAAEEERLLQARTAAERISGRRFWIVLWSAGALLLVVAATSVLIIRRYTRDLALSQETLRQLNAGLEDAVRERTTDLQRANDEIQRFAYIVSHDLRSPLVNVMGFTAEIEALGKPLRAMIERLDGQDPALVDAAARAAILEELPESTSFIRSSTQKMDRLINAILRLSREGRRTIVPEPIDLNAVVESAAASVKHRLAEQGGHVEVEGRLPTIVSDRLAVEQIVSNLVDNAVKYLKPGRPGLIRVSAARAGGRVRLSVADNGRGIEPRDHERVFDLFRRSGVQDQPGEGIGLAHVRASAYRLGGWIELQSELDQGATFTLNLPVQSNEQRAKAA